MSLCRLEFPLFCALTSTKWLKSSKSNGSPFGAAFIHSTMKTEIQQLTEAWSAYTAPQSTAAFYDAERVLLRFHAKYGTIDIPTIKQLIR